MGGRSAAAKGATAEPPGRPPQPPSATLAEPPEPLCEPGPRSLEPTERSSQTPARFSPEQTRRSGSPTGSTRQQRSQELTPRLSSSSYSSEPVQPPGSTTGRERKKRPPTGGRGPSQGAAPPTPPPRHAHSTISLVSTDTGPLQGTPPNTAQKEQVPIAAGLGRSGSLCQGPSCGSVAPTPGSSICEEEAGKPQTQKGIFCVSRNLRRRKEVILHLLFLL